MRIRTKLYLAFGALVLLVALTAGLILFNILRARNELRDLNETQARLTALANDIRYYDATLTEAVRAYLIDPQDRAAYERYYRDAQALDAALAEAKNLATSNEDRQTFENIDRVNVELVQIEEALLTDPDIEQAIPLYRGTYGQLKAEYSSYVEAFFARQRAVLQTHQEKVLSRLEQVLIFTLASVVILLLMSIAIALILSRNLLTPIYALGNVASRFAQKDFTVRATASSDETGVLAATLNDMAEHIGSLVKGLETRTGDLEAVIEVSSRISAILNIKDLLQDVVDLVRERFKLYHAHVYLLDETGENLVLAAGAGYIGELMVAEKRTIPLNHRTSVVASAARSLRGVVLNDVTKSLDFLPHVLLPDTRSEAAVALVARNQLLGVLDVQSNRVDFFTDEFYAILEVIAKQIAAAVSNARLYTEAERTSRHERALGNITRNIETATSVDEILQTTVRELGRALRVPYAAIELHLGNDENPVGA